MTPILKKMSTTGRNSTYSTLRLRNCTELSAEIFLVRMRRIFGRNAGFDLVFIWCLYEDEKEKRRKGRWGRKKKQRKPSFLEKSDRVGSVDGKLLGVVIVLVFRYTAVLLTV